MKTSDTQEWAEPVNGWSEGTMRSKGSSQVLADMRQLLWLQQLDLSLCITRSQLM